MEIIDLCSDGEDDTKSPSDGVGITLLGLDRKDKLGSDHPSDGVDRSLVLFNTQSGQNNGKHPLALDDADWLTNTHASSSYRSPAVSSQHRIYPLSSSSVMLHGSSYSSSLKVLSENDDGVNLWQGISSQVTCSFSAVRIFVPVAVTTLEALVKEQDLVSDIDATGNVGSLQGFLLTTDS